MVGRVAKHCESKRKDFFIVGEVWNHDLLIAKYYKGLSSNFHFSLSWNLIAALKNEKNDSVVQKLRSGIEKFKSQRGDIVDAIFFRITMETVFDRCFPQTLKKLSLQL